MANLSKERIGRITASAVGAILGHNPHKSRDDVMRDMVRAYHGAEAEFKGNAATEYGNNTEQTAINRYEHKMRCTVERDPDFVKHKDYGFLGCTPDGLIVDKNKIIEVKCPYSKKLFDLKEKPYYLDQVYLQLVCTQAKECDFFVYVSDNEFSIETIYLDDAEKWLSENIVELNDFYAEFRAIVQDKELSKPYLEDLVCDLSQDEIFTDLESSYLEYSQEIKSLESKLKEIKNKMIALAKEKGKKCKGATVSVYPCERKGAIDYSKVPELNEVDLEQYRKKSTTYWVVK